MLELIVLLNPVYVTLFWAVVLNFYSPARNAPKAFLGKFMLVAFVLYLSHFFYFSGKIEMYRLLDAVYICASLMVYPLYHIYIRLLTVEKKFTKKKHIRYLLLPVLVFLFYLAGLIIMDRNEHIEFLEFVITGSQKPGGIYLYMIFVYNAWRLVFVAQVFYYLYVNFILMKRKNKQLQDYYSNTESRRLNWIQFFNISLAVISISSITVAVTGRETFAGATFLLIIPSIVFSAMLFFIGLIGNTQNPAHTINLEIEEPKTYNQQENVNTRKLKRQLDKVFEKEKIFINPDLKIWDVSKMLGTNRTYVSRLINEEYNRNFSNHVNYYRVKQAMELIEKNPRLTNEQVAELSGFGSVNSLYRAFPATEQLSLKEYRKKAQSS